eukprot:TRINITY_DN19133_c0_g1_i2.p1 TRINITY_DN19133_c0_g1~~TRINITY_DN19133_c0_g1_i2.p1  ORF type:complete len:523 (-),score=88.24 TRINITY_DN19133_c0_g1_i2:177-1745(-)
MSLKDNDAFGEAGYADVGKPEVCKDPSCSFNLCFKSHRVFPGTFEDSLLKELRSINDQLRLLPQMEKHLLSVVNLEAKIESLGSANGSLACNETDSANPSPFDVVGAALVLHHEFRSEEERRGSDVDVSCLATAEADERSSTPASPRTHKRPSMASVVLTFPPMHQARAHLWNFLENTDSSRGAALFNVFIASVIMMSVVISLLHTVEPSPFTPITAATLEGSCDVVFLADIVVRFLACPNRLSFFRSFYNIVDICAVSPLILRASFSFKVPAENDNFVVRCILVLVVPFIRLLKILRRCEYLRLLRHMAEFCMEALTVPLFLLLLINVFFSSVMYLVEPRDNIPSVPHAMWLVVVTMSTVGYGDMVPVSLLGHLIMTLLVVGGVLYMALPISIMGHAFANVWNRRDEILLMEKTRDRLQAWGYTVYDLHMIFKRFDSNEDYVLELHEFRSMVEEMQLGLSDRRIVDLFDAFDRDKSGYVDYMEFSKSLFPGHYLEVQELYKKRKSKVAATASQVSSRNSST